MKIPIHSTDNGALPRFRSTSILYFAEKLQIESILKDKVLFKKEEMLLTLFPD